MGIPGKRRKKENKAMTLKGENVSEWKLELWIKRPPNAENKY